MFTIHINPVHGTTPIFDINNYSKKIESAPPPHAFDQTLIYSIMDNTSSESAIRTLESTPPKKTVSVRMKIDSGANGSLTSNKNILYFYKDVTPFSFGSIDEGGTVICTGAGI